ncbi:MAG TPA: ABC-2 family transporter protein [Polyangia bacterium]|nr:ABC-2 family transporter protein [Polyangia bacterium]
MNDGASERFSERERAEGRDRAWRRFWRAYPTLLRVGLSEAVAYRAEFIVWMLATTMPLVMLAIMTAMARDAPVGRFDQPGFVAYYLVTLVVRQMTGAWAAWEMNREIKEGTLALRLLKPIHPLAGYSADALAAVPMRALLSLPLAIIVLIISAHDHMTHDPVVIFIFIVSLPGAWLLNFAVSATIGTLGLFIESSLQVWELWFGAYMLLSGYLIPLELFPHWAEHIARCLPFAYLQAFPVETLTGRHGRADALAGLAAQFAWAAAAWAMLLVIWRRGQRRFAAYGG